MIEMFRSGGVVMWPMLPVAVGIAWLAVRNAIRLGSRSLDREGVQRGLQAILFWGFVSVVLGVIGTVGGLVVMTQSIARAGSVEPPLVWGGVGVSLVTLIFGLVIFLFATIAWFGLRQWSARIEGGDAAVQA